MDGTGGWNGHPAHVRSRRHRPCSAAMHVSCGGPGRDKAPFVQRLWSWRRAQPYCRDDAPIPHHRCRIVTHRDTNVTRSHGARPERPRAASERLDHVGSPRRTPLGTARDERRRDVLPAAIAPTSRRSCGPSPGRVVSRPDVPRASAAWHANRSLVPGMLQLATDVWSRPHTLRMSCGRKAAGDDCKARGHNELVASRGESVGSTAGAYAGGEARLFHPGHPSLHCRRCIS